MGRKPNLQQVQSSSICTSAAGECQGTAGLSHRCRARPARPHHGARKLHGDGRVISSHICPATAELATPESQIPPPVPPVVTQEPPVWGVPHCPAAGGPGPGQPPVCLLGMRCRRRLHQSQAVIHVPEHLLVLVGTAPATCADASRTNLQGSPQRSVPFPNQHRLEMPRAQTPKTPRPPEL